VLYEKGTIVRATNGEYVLLQVKTAMAAPCRD
jgi:hypothetical protein